MGVLYTVWPLGHDIAPWLDELGVSRPVGPMGSTADASGDPRCERIGRRGRDRRGSRTRRRPLAGTRAGGGRPKEGHWTLVDVADYAGEDAACSLGFEEGWPDLIAAIVLEVSRRVGPLVLIPDTGDSPLVLSEDIELGAALRAWEQVR